MTVRTRTARWTTAIVALLVSVLALSGCTAGSPSDAAPGPEARLAAFIAAWQAGDATKAADLTSDPAAATVFLDEVTANLDPRSLAVAAGSTDRTGPDTATTPVTYTWTFAETETWSYPATWAWQRQPGGDWTLDWSPTVVHPQLSERQTLSVTRTEAQPGVLVDRNNVQLASPIRVYSVVMKASGPAVAPTAAAVAPVLARIDKTITADSIVAGAADAVAQATAPAEAAGSASAQPGASGSASPAPSSPASAAPVKPADVTYTVINLRERDYQKLKAQLATIPGLTFPSDVRDLPPTKDFAKAVLPQVTAVAEPEITGTPGWKVIIVDTTGGTLETLADHPAVPGSRVVVTLDSTLQQKAEAVLAPIQLPAVLVAIQPSTGEILAVAQNRPANTQGSIALTGQYPPGSTFKVVTATAGLEAGLLTPTTAVACPGVFAIDGREIRNSHDFDLGTVDATMAFARSCNTTFANLAVRMPPDALTAAASEYGIGLDFVMPGATTLTGKAPQAPSQVQRAENGFGQGQVLMTPFSAALMAATAANGAMPMPTLIRGMTTTVDKKPATRPAPVQQGIQTLMQAVVQEGTAQELKRFGDVHAKTGTAEFTVEDGSTHAHAWTIGYLGDLAFAALVVGGEGSGATVNLVANFLTAAKQP
jgi:cell division protein FtsI/penicillin-binding protein 2